VASAVAAATVTIDRKFTRDIPSRDNTDEEYAQNTVSRSLPDAFVFLLRSNATPGKVSPWRFESAPCVRPPAD
jgi:hypothetical protein